MLTKKILLYSINYSPELTGIGKYNGEMVSWLKDNGYEVRVVTAPPYYPEWKVKEGYTAYKYTSEKIDGVRIWRCPLWVPRKPTGLKRILHLVSFALSSLPVLLMQLFWMPHLLIVIEPPLVLSPLAVCVSKLFRIRSWLHVQDFEVDAAFELGLLPQNKFIKKSILGVEQWLMGKFNVVSSISEPMINRLLGKGVPREKVKYFPNWVNLSSIYPMTKHISSIRCDLGIAEHDFVILYAGNIGEKQGLEIVIEAAEQLKEHTHIYFVVCGNGAAKDKLLQHANQKKLQNVKFLPLQPLEKLNELLNMANVHALIQKQSASDLVMPSKLTGMLASGRPIIATTIEHTAVSSLLKDARAGILVSPGDVEEFSEAILALQQDVEAGKRFGQNAREYAVKHLSKESIMEQFELDLKLI